VGCLELQHDRRDEHHRVASDGGSRFALQVGDPSGAFDVIGCSKRCKVR
jgi:hypothetical protein